MNLPKSIGLLLFALLAFIPKIIVASPPNQRTIRSNKSANQTSTNKSPYWEYVLREFVFKTLSSPSHTSNILYKKLLDAPFYGGPLPTPSNEDNLLLSRGNVYQLSNGQWILCQDNCNNCTPCTNQKNSIVKWTLRKVKRFVSAESYKYDLQLTVIPQLRNDHLEHIQTANKLHVQDESANDSGGTSTTKMSHVDRSRTWKRMQRDDHEQLNHYNDINEDTESLNGSSSSISTLNYQQDELDSNEFVSTRRLIMGIDQHAKKYIIHVVSIGTSGTSSIDHVPSNNKNENITVNYNHNQNIRGLSYQQYINQLIESINSHRPIIEAFLSYNRMKITNTTAPFYPVYSEFIDNNNKNLNSNFITRNNNNRLRDWSRILTRTPRDKNYIPKLIKKFNGNFPNIILSRSNTQL